jgi:autotransporter-associated beta strand protein
MNRGNIVLGSNGALGSWYARAGNPNQGVGFNLLSDDDARTITTLMELRQWQSIKGEHSLEWAAGVFQTNSRGWVNLLPSGKIFKLSGTQFAMLTDSSERTYAFDGTGRTEVTGGLYDKADVNTLQPVFDGSLGHYRKTGTGTVDVSGVASTYHGNTMIEAGVWRFSGGAHLTNTAAIVSTGGAIGIDTGTFTNATLLGKIDAADTGGLIVSPGEAASALDFTSGLLANAANMSVAAPETGITFTGTIAPANSTYRLGGGTGTLTLPGANQLTGPNNLVVTNGGEVQLTAVNNYSGTTTITGTPYISRTNQAIADTTAGISTNMYAPTTLTVTHLGRFGSADSMGISSDDPMRLLIQGSTLKYIGGDVKTDRLFTVGTLGATLDSSGPGASFFESPGPIGIQPGGAGLARTLTFAGTTGGSFSPSINNASDGGSVGVAKNGSGEWVLRGNNTYSGATNVEAGSLIVHGVHTGGGNYNVATNAVLGGLGAITGAANVSGTIAPGYNVVRGDFEVSGNVIFSAGSSLAVDLGGSSADVLAVHGDLDLSALGNSLDVSVLDPLSGSNWIVATYSGQLTGMFETVTAGYTIDYGAGANSHISISLAPPTLPGDYNDDGQVDAADYVVWRKYLGTDFPLAGNGNQQGTSAGVVDDADYLWWNANYGTISAPDSAGRGAFALSEIPEPASWLWALGTLIGSRFLRPIRRSNQIDHC